MDTSGPAFPTEPNTQPGFYQHHGMSLRDWFAGQFLMGAATDHSALDDDLSIAADQTDVDAALQDFWGTASRTAYIAADAMLAARNDVRAVNAYPALVEALEEAKAAITTTRTASIAGAEVGYDCHTGDWAERVYCSHGGLTKALAKIDAALALSARGDGA